MFLHLSVILFTGGLGPGPGGGLGALARGRVSRPWPRGRLGGLAKGVWPGGLAGAVFRPTPRGVQVQAQAQGGVSQHALRQTPPPPQQTATAAGGRHPTGIPSLLFLIFVVLLNEINTIQTELNPGDKVHRCKVTNVYSVYLSRS